MIATLTAGQSISTVRSFTEDDVVAFARVAGGGILDQVRALDQADVPNSLLSAHLAGFVLSRLLGPGATLSGLMLRFRHSVKVDEDITMAARILSLHERDGIVRVALSATARHGVCVDGEAVARIPIGQRISG